tara:strand:- start:1564 stop:2769 length:1206 start_codon:yes stop_codon:yes gene_type:complete
MPVLGSGSTGVVGGIYQATASGAIAHGKACIINSNGTVSQAAAALGKKIVFAVSNNNIYQYKLVNAYDVTLVLTIGGETANSYYEAGQDGAGYQDQFYSLVSGQESGITAIQFNNDGTKFFVMGYSGDDVNEYTLSTAYDLSTGTFVDAYDISGKSTSPHGLDFKPDGTEMYVVSYGDSNVHQWTLSTGWDVSTASFTRTFDTTRDDYRHGIRFKPDGTKMYICGGNYTSDDKTDQYTLSTAWDISTASYDSVSLDHSSHDITPLDILWNDDGTKFYMLGGSGHTITEYTCSTAYQLSSASFTSESFIVSAGHDGMAFSQGGTATNENYIGISQGAVSDGGTASIKVIGGIDTNQSGLTPNALCYIADSGTITSTNTGVIAGQALTPTTVLIKNTYDMLFD